MSRLNKSVFSNKNKKKIIFLYIRADETYTYLHPTPTVSFISKKHNKNSNLMRTRVAGVCGVDDVGGVDTPKPTPKCVICVTKNKKLFL